MRGPVIAGADEDEHRYREVGVSLQLASRVYGNHGGKLAAGFGQSGHGLFLDRPQVWSLRCSSENGRAPMRKTKRADLLRMNRRHLRKVECGRIDIRGALS